MTYDIFLQLKSQGRGEILVSLCYQPAANRITVVVLKARNLPKMDLTGLSGNLHDNDALLCSGTSIHYTYDVIYVRSVREDLLALQRPEDCEEKDPREKANLEPGV